MIHLYFFDEYHNKSNKYKIQFLKNFNYFNIIQNSSILICQIFFYLTDFFSKNISDYTQNKTMINMILENSLTLMILIFFSPPKINLSEKFYLKKNKSMVSI